MKKQMYKVHAPHRESGYIVKVEYQGISDREGKPDWEILYTPGDKAFVEHQAFTRRNGGQATPGVQAPQPHNRPFSALQQQALAFEQGTPSHETFLIELTRRGITEKKATELLDNLSPGQEVTDQIEWTDAIIAKAPAGSSSARTRP